MVSQPKSPDYLPAGRVMETAGSVEPGPHKAPRGLLAPGRVASPTEKWLKIRGVSKQMCGMTMRVPKRNTQIQQRRLLRRALSFVPIVNPKRVVLDRPTDCF